MGETLNVSRYSVLHQHLSQMLSGDVLIVTAPTFALQRETLPFAFLGLHLICGINET